MRRALDLFCCAGGATRGLQMAGFHVTGVDIQPQPRYCGDAFIQADAPTFLCQFVGGSMDHSPEICDRCGRHYDHPGHGRYDLIWASPPCQKHSTLRSRHAHREYACCITATREALKQSMTPYVIENVMGAPLFGAFMLCGSSFGLKVQRHRMFEVSFPVPLVPQRNHTADWRPIDVSGTGSRRRGERKDGKGGNPNKPRSLTEAREAIGIDWMTRPEIAQAIPPAYSHFIARQWLATMEATDAA